MNSSTWSPHNLRWSANAAPACCGFLVILAWTSTAHAAPSCSVDAERPKLYRLELSVPATFCGNHRNDPSCQVFPKPTRIQLHGLWPNYRSGFPQGECPPGECPRQDPGLGSYCRYPEPPGLYDSSAWKDLKGFMTGTENCLERHEWVKHGTCSPMDAPTYFQWSLETTKRIATALDLPSDRPVSRKKFNQRVARNLKDLDGSVRLSCKNGALSSLYVLYEWDPVPARPIPTRNNTNHFGNCPNSFLIPAVPRG